MHKVCTLAAILLLAGPALAGSRFKDNGDGTITDTKTGLMWEKKSDDGGIHDKDNKYIWTAKYDGIKPDGTAFTVFLRGLNDGRCEVRRVTNAASGKRETALLCDEEAGARPGFAGYSDWRLPTVEELQDIVDYGRSNPAIDPVFHNNCKEGCTVTQCSCTASSFYWSSTTFAGLPDFAWSVPFRGGSVGRAPKSDFYYVRAVRSGL
jgi:hypothetical protein